MQAPEVALLPSSAWRSPALRLIANGQPIAGVIEAEVTANNHFATDRFSARIALGAGFVVMSRFWGATQQILVDLQFSLDGAGFRSLIQALVDSVVLDPVAALVRIEGRDLTAPLIETRTQDAFANRTSSEIATLLAQRHGLIPAVTTTTTPVGRYYQNEHDRITLNQFSRATTEWDLLVFLARQEGFDVFVQGTTLFFQPAQQATDLIVLRTTDLSELRLQRSLTLARDIEVTVKSWNSRQKTAFSQTAKASGRRSPGAGGIGPPKPQRYVLVRPNLTPDQALQLAQRKLAELTQHERVVEASMPGELALTPRSQITLAGTGTDFDQTYFVDVIERTLSPQTGFTQRIRAKNSSPRTETTTPADIIGAVAEP
jgi:phage protein D